MDSLCPGFYEFSLYLLDNQLQRRVEYLEEQGSTVVLVPALLTCHVVVETLVIFVLPEMILLRPEIIMILPGMLLILPGLIVTCWHRPYTVPPPHHDQNRGQT